jgi:glutamate racemase
MLILACNTATAAAVREVRREWPRIPVVGMEPGLKPAISSSHRRRVGILATRGTLRSDKFRLLLERYGSGTEVICQPCPGLVELVEQGALEHAETEALLRRYLAPLLEQGIDALVLGCTHYPFLIPIIRRLMDDSVSLVDTGEAVARQARRILDEQGLRSPSPAPGATLFHTTGDPEKQRAIFRLLWGDEVEIGAWRAD